MKRLEEIESRENKREQRNNELLKNLEGSISNFDTATEKTEKRFKNAALHYVERIDTDNQKQDFKEALRLNFKGIINGVNDLNKKIEAKTQATDKQVREYEQLIQSKTEKNDKLIDRLNKSLHFMTTGITGMFFVVAIIALVVLVTGPIGEYFGVTQLYELINHVIKTSDSVWRYLMLILYVLPYALFGLIILGILKAFDSLR
ncbi:DUF334 domain-containing protein [Staphylococcus ureilyticus]